MNFSLLKAFKCQKVWPLQSYMTVLYQILVSNSKFDNFSLKVRKIRVARTITLLKYGKVKSYQLILRSRIQRLGLPKMPQLQFQLQLQPLLQLLFIKIASDFQLMEPQDRRQLTHTIHAIKINFRCFLKPMIELGSTPLQLLLHGAKRF